MSVRTSIKIIGRIKRAYFQKYLGCWGSGDLGCWSLGEGLCSIVGRTGRKLFARLGPFAEFED